MAHKITITSETRAIAEILNHHEAVEEPFIFFETSDLEFPSDFVATPNRAYLLNGCVLGALSLDQPNFQLDNFYFYGDEVSAVKTRIIQLDSRELNFHVCDHLQEQSLDSQSFNLLRALYLTYIDTNSGYLQLQGGRLDYDLPWIVAEFLFEKLEAFISFDCLCGVEANFVRNQIAASEIRDISE